MLVAKVLDKILPLVQTCGAIQGRHAFHVVHKVVLPPESRPVSSSLHLPRK
jgi:hypothetical protein